jgi:predicted transcriptional regulator
MNLKKEMTVSNSETVLRILRENGPMNSRSVVRMSGLTKRAVSVALGRLTEQGHVRRTSDGVVILQFGKCQKEQ